MIRVAKVRTVAWFELSSTVRRLGYLIVTLGMPIFATLYGALALIPGYLAKQQEEQTRVYGVVDQAGVLGLEPGATVEVRTAIFRAFAGEPEARRALVSDRSVRSYFVVVTDYLDSGRVLAHSGERSSLGPWEGRDELNELLRTRLVGPRVDPRVAARLVKPIAGRETFRVSGDGRVEAEGSEAFIGRLILPIGFVFLLFTSILMSGSYLIQATATEKENKVVEVLLSSASADEIMTGKLLGLGGAGLLQVIVWLSMTLGVRFGFAQMVLPLNIHVSWQAVLISPVLFITAYAFLGSLMLGTGSFGGNVRESQQLGMFWAFLATLPLMFLPLLLTDPHSVIAHVLTWIPFSAPATLVFRMSLDPDGISIWEISGSLLVLLLSTWAAIRVASRLFRVGLLLTGARPSLREIWRQARV
ncbi:MAG: ABC transporter permease [Myxococcales bacterium]|nr:ABC transporter permease [Myxococcales bacterium]